MQHNDSYLVVTTSCKNGVKKVGYSYLVAVQLAVLAYCNLATAVLQ